MLIPFIPSGGALGWQGPWGLCGQGGGDNYGGKTSIIYACL